MAKRSVDQVERQVLPPPGIPLIFNFQSSYSPVHGGYVNTDHDLRCDDDRVGIEEYDRILYVGSGKKHCWHGLVTGVKDGFLTIHWDFNESVQHDSFARVEASKCALIPYPHEEGMRKIGVFREKEYYDMSVEGANKKKKAK